MNQTIDCYFVAMGNRLPWQQTDISISQLSDGVESPDLVQG